MSIYLYHDPLHDLLRDPLRDRNPLDRANYFQDRSILIERRKLGPTRGVLNPDFP